MSTPWRPATGVPRPGVEYEFQRIRLPAEHSKSFVKRLLTDQAERGGWELNRVRIGADGVRRIVLRRKIIRHRIQLALSSD